MKQKPIKRISKVKMRIEKIYALLLIVMSILWFPHNLVLAQEADWQITYNKAKNTFERKEYASAIVHCQKHLAFLKSVVPRRYDDEFLFLSLLREIYTEANQQTKARQTLDELMTYEQYAKGANDLKSMQASIARQQAEVAFKAGDTESAIQFYKTALLLYKESYGDKHARVLECLQKLTACYQEQNDPSYALLFQEEAAQLKKAQVPCKDDPTYYDSFIQQVSKQVLKNWFPEKLSFSYTIKVLFHLDATGQASSIRITQSAGNPRADQAAIDAILRTSFNPTTFPSFCYRDSLPMVMSFDHTLEHFSRWSLGR